MYFFLYIFTCITCFICKTCKTCIICFTSFTHFLSSSHHSLHLEKKPIKHVKQALFALQKNWPWTSQGKHPRPRGLSSLRFHWFQGEISLGLLPKLGQSVSWQYKKFAKPGIFFSWLKLFDTHPTHNIYPPHPLV